MSTSKIRLILVGLALAMSLKAGLALTGTVKAAHAKQQKMLDAAINTGLNVK